MPLGDAVEKTAPFDLELDVTAFDPVWVGDEDEDVVTVYAARMMFAACSANPYVGAPSCNI